MIFLYPGFLWALSALSIPILIHLFNFRKTIRVYFTNTRFLKQVQEVTTAKRKLKHYLILASRLLFLTFLVLAFAQPFIPAREQLEGGRNITFYLDNSQSLSVPMSDNSRALDVSLGFARSIVEHFPPDTRYKLVTNDFAPFSNTYKAKAEILDLLTQVRLSPVSRTVQEVKQRLEEEKNHLNDVFWISDFQKSTFGKVPVEWDSLSRWHLVPITLAAASNVFIDTIYLDNPFAVGGEKNVLRVNVRNDGKQVVEQVNLKLMVNTIQAAITSVRVPSGGIQEASFDLVTGLHNLNEVKISFNDFPVSFDNEFFLALNFTDKIRVIEIRANEAPTPVERVYGNSNLFDFRAYTVNNFNYALLKQADLVVVNGLPRIETSLAGALREYISEFGTLFFIPAVKADVASYQNFIGVPLKSGVEPVLESLDQPDFADPFFAHVFEEKSASLAMPKASKCLEWGNDRLAILQFKDTKPALSRFDQGGKLYIFSSPLQAEYTTLHVNAMFVPIMYRIAAGSKKNDNRLYYTMNESLVSLRTDSLQGEEPLRLLGQQEIVPAQRKIQDKVLMEIPKFSVNQGFYYVLDKRDTLGLLAFNPEKAESLLEQYTGTEVKKMLGERSNISIFEADSPEAFGNEIKARYLGKPLWKYAVILALVFLLTEALLIRFLK